MSPPTQSVEIIWGPGFAIGLTLAMVMFGVSIGQVVFYYSSFPKDSRLLKFGVFAILVLDVLHTACVTGTFWRILVLCQGAMSSACQMNFTWDALGGLTSSYTITLLVQSFYVHRVWIISKRNKVVTGAIILAASFQILFGTLCVHSVFHSRNWQLFGRAYPALASTASSICDLLITISVAYFLRSEDSHLLKRDHPIRRLKLIVMELGLMSFAVSVLVVAMLVFPPPELRQYWAFVPGPILAKAYFNSMLAVLNSRRTIRERQFQARGQMYNLATIRTTNV